MPRFTLSLHHSESPHFDMFMEKTKGTGLNTWSFPQDQLPMLAEGQSIRVTIKDDHREKYLDFEGDLDDNRGTITIRDQGEWKQINPDTIMVRGKLIKGTLAVARESDHTLMVVLTPIDEV